MTRQSNRPRALLALVGCLILPAASRAQAPNSLSAETLEKASIRNIPVLKRASFAAVIKLVADKLQLSITADDDSPELPDSITLNGTGTEVLDRIGRLYGFRWTVAGNSVLFTRTYLKPDTLPQFVKSEAIFVADKILGWFQGQMTIDYTRSLSPIIRRLGDSFSPAQRTALLANKPVLWAELTQPQKQIVTDAVTLKGYREVFETWRTFLGIAAHFNEMALQHYLPAYPEMADKTIPKPWIISCLIPNVLGQPLRLVIAPQRQVIGER